MQTLYLSCLELASELDDVALAPRWVSEAPARLAGLAESKGRIAAGFDADLVLVDPARPTAYSPRIMKSRQRHSALVGLRSSFSIRSVYLRGVPVARAAGRQVRPATPSPARS